MPRPALLALVLTAGCMPTFEQPPQVGGDEPGARWERTSMAPQVGYLQSSEHARVAIDGVAFSDDLYGSDRVTTSAATKLDELAAQLGREWGTGAPELLGAEDRERAATIPFRGNPSDVAVTRANDRSYAAIPLGGDLMTPGNEVAIVRDDGGLARVKVGIRPQRIAAHPAGVFFVCNQYSSYVSVIDAPAADFVRDEAGDPVELRADLFCGDIALLPRDGTSEDAAAQWLVIANPERRTVTATAIKVVREGGKARLTQGAGEAPGVTISDVGPYPARLAPTEDGRGIYVASTRGDTIALLDLDAGTVVRSERLGAPAVDVIAVRGLTLVPTTMVDRGLLRLEDVPASLVAPPVVARGLDGADHDAHPGALTDESAGYGFEDVRNGLLAMPAELGAPPLYYTDDISPERAYASGQKILAGALPQAIARSADGSRVYVAMGGSDLVQELLVEPSATFALRPSGRTFRTRERPMGLAVDEALDRLLVATWGGEMLETFDLASGGRITETDLGYASPRYPATGIEEGERLFASAAWSNNGRKTCAHCHLDELVTDGMSFANGAASPVALHKIPSNHNLLTTDAYFWNGSLAGGNYRSLAFAAQVRTNCEVVLFGLAEGPGAPPETRVGDPANRFTTGAADDRTCRPEALGDSGLPENFGAAISVRDEQLDRADDLVREATGRSLDEISRLIDFYSVSELRLPPNPARHKIARGLVSDAYTAQLAKGEALFATGACSVCHQPGNARAPFSDGLQHGRGGGWSQRFAERYGDDARLTDLIGELPPSFMEAAQAMPEDREVNVHVPVIDYFVPFCFGDDDCLVFEDPMTASDEDAALDRLIRVNLADEDRGFIPGNVVGQPAVNTPSLRSVWGEVGLLHHGLAGSISEAVLAPGHAALPEGRSGWAILDDGTTDVHGLTSTMSADDLRALELYLRSIE